MIKQIQLFLLADDEAAFSAALLNARPRLVFVDGARWNTSNPPLVESVSTCTSWWSFLWDTSVVESLPVYVRKDGKFEGPTAGLVIELTRSALQGGALLSGRLAASTDVADKKVAQAMDRFADDVWKVMKAVTQAVIAVDPQTGKVIRDKVPEYRAGHHAAAWGFARAGELLPGSQRAGVLQIQDGPLTVCATDVRSADECAKSGSTVTKAATVTACALSPTIASSPDGISASQERKCQVYVWRFGLT